MEEPTLRLMNPFPLECCYSSEALLPQVTNLGPAQADGVVVTDDPATTFVATGSDPRCGPDGGAVFTCAIGTLTAGSQTSLLVKTDCMVPTLNSASVAASSFDPNTANNSVSNVASGPCPS